MIDRIEEEVDRSDRLQARFNQRILWESTQDGVIDIDWTVPVGRWGLCPRELYEGDELVEVYGIPDRDDPESSSRALFRATGPIFFKRHRHPYRERVAIIYGSGRYWTARTGLVEVNPEKNAVYAFDPNEAHEFWTDGMMYAFLWFFPGEE